MIKTTVVIPNFNGSEYISNCLKSVFNSDTEVAVTVVDNGSSDGSVETVMKDFPQVKLIRLDENTGFCHATNLGIASSETEYVMFLNNDTVVNKDSIGILESFLDANPKAFSAQALMVQLKDSSKVDSAGDFYCALGWAFGRGKDKPVTKYRPVCGDVAGPCKAGKVFSGCGGACLYRKSVLDEIGFLDENHFAYLEDVDLGYRALLAGYDNYVCYDSVILHAGSGFSGSRHNEFKVKLSAQNSIYLIYKNQPILQVLINLPFLIIGYAIKLLFFILKGLGKPYLQGIAAGIKLSFSDSGKPHRVKFVFNRLKSYIKVQFLLWINIFRRIF